MSYTHTASHTAKSHGGITSAVGDDQQSYDHAFFDATVSHIRQVVDEDVEMAGPVPDVEVHLIVDTNILLHHFDVLRQFAADIEAQALPLMIVIPRAVLDELDRQKNRKDLAWFARRATTWILEKAKERRVVKGQRLYEILQDEASRQDVDVLRSNDMRILDCAMYFTRTCGGVTFLCTHDRNLRANCEFEDVKYIEPTAKWSSREVLHSMFPDSPLADRFASHRIVYRPQSKVQAPTREGRPAARVRSDDDDMDIDDDSATEVLLPSHALDSLHLQVVDHFRLLLQELVRRVGGAGIAAGTATRSAHAPGFARKLYSEWTATESLEFLGLKKRLPTTTPRVDVFFALPYSGRGARRGQDWPRQAWEQALTGMARFGEQWGEASVKESLEVLAPHCAIVFSTPMRPTGM